MRNLETAKSKSLNIENFIATRSKYIHSGLYSGKEKKTRCWFISGRSFHSRFCNVFYIDSHCSLRL